MDCEFDRMGSSSKVLRGIVELILNLKLELPSWQERWGTGCFFPRDHTPSKTYGTTPRGRALSGRDQSPSRVRCFFLIQSVVPYYLGA